MLTKMLFVRRQKIFIGMATAYMSIGWINSLIMSAQTSCFTFMTSVCPVKLFNSYIVLFAVSSIYDVWNDCRVLTNNLLVH